MSARGRLVVLEGGEGSGKSTQARLLAKALGAELTREPGGTTLGEAIRGVLLDGESSLLDRRAELLLMVAARAQHVSERLRPLLSAGKDVVCDRYSGSTLAYQGYGRGIALDEVERACVLAEDGITPDLTVLLDVPVAFGFARLSSHHDRIEKEDKGFHERVRQGFLSIARSHPTSWIVVDGTEDRDEVFRCVRAAVTECLSIGATP